MSDGTTPAPDDQVWVCRACGKTSRTQYGFDANNQDCSDRGWDESCMLNAVLCWKARGSKGWKPVEKAPEPEVVLTRIERGES